MPYDGTIDPHELARSFKLQSLMLNWNDAKYLTALQLYEIYRQKKLNEHHNIQTTQQDIEKARAVGYVLGADWKTIKAFKGCRLVKDDVNQVAVEYSYGDIRWINSEIF